MNDLPSFADPTNLVPKKDLAIEERLTERRSIFFRQVYRRSILPLPTRMRAATAALPHEHPKFAVTTVVNVGDFADQLEKAIERSRKVSTNND